MASFYGFGIEGYTDDKFYNMRKDMVDLDAQSYAEYSTVYFGITFIPSLLLGGPIIQSCNRSNFLGMSTVIWGACSILHAFATRMWMLYILIAIIGMLSGLSASLTHQLVTEYFEEKYWTRAYFAYSILKQIGDSARFMTPVLIKYTGWRMAWIIGGGFGVVSGLLMVFLVAEPKVPSTMVVSSNENEK